jgi:hypothetical protein
VVDADSLGYCTGKLQQPPLAFRNFCLFELELAGVPGLRRDVDTLTDLCQAARIGLGARTLSVRESIKVACA